MEQGPSRYRYLLTIDSGGGGGWAQMSMLFFVPAALCWGKRWGAKLRLDKILVHAECDAILSVASRAMRN